jgi:hypothetical protein
MSTNRATLHAVGAPEDVRGDLEDALFEIKRVIVGQEAMLERVLVALLAGGTCCSRASRASRRR